MPRYNAPPTAAEQQDWCPHVDEKWLDDLEKLDRSELQAILEAHGFAVFESETRAELLEVVCVNIEDGTIAKEDI